MGRDFLSGAEKVKRIMGKTMYICRHCSMSHEKYSQAVNCCLKKQRSLTACDKAEIKERKNAPK